MIEIIRPKIVKEEENENHGTFVIEPLERGFGHTLGNSLRRVLISSLPGAAATWVRVDGAAHEFTTIEGAREDLTEIILNIKQIVFKMDGDESYIVKLEESGQKDVTAGDLKLPAGLEVINKELHLLTLNKKGKIKLEMQVEKGRGYISSEKNKKTQQPIGVIPIDSIFSPIRTVSFNVENTRVGQRTDYDKLVLNTKTDGSMSAKDAVGQAAKIVSDHMTLFIETLAEEPEATFSSEQFQRDQSLNVPIEQLDLSVRAYNCLKRQGISTLEELVNCSESDLMNIRNFGTKSIDEIKDKLAQMDLSLKQGD